eukprot:6427804-Prymnesium_polylepis.2
MAAAPAAPSSRPRVLTVGDGDLSYSLALARAFGDALQLTASVLLSEAELKETYAGAAHCITELTGRGVSVRYGMNAAALATAEPSLGEQDHILFAHPHLGLADLESVSAHARRHEVLLAHFLQSASELLPAAGGCVHLTLCGNQPRAWSIASHGERVGFAPPLSAVPNTASAFLHGAALAASLTPMAALPEWGARRRFRSGGLGCKHWLSAYGYEHRRSEGDLDMNVDRTVELVFCRPRTEATTHAPADCTVSEAAGDSSTFHCRVCGFEWDDEESLRCHVARLATPEPVEQLREWRSRKTPCKPALTAQAEGGAAPAPAAHECVHCGQTFASRNRLFAHLGEGCDVSASSAAKKGGALRLVLSVGYVGVGFHGCSFNTPAEETERPTVGGTILAAAGRAWGTSRNGEAPTEGGERSAEPAAVSGLPNSCSISFACRTEKGVSAAETWCVLTLSGGGTATRHDSAALARELQGTRVRLLGSIGCVAEGPFMDLRHVAIRQAYKYALPYALLLTSDERATRGVDEGPSGIWLTGLVGDATCDELEAFLQAEVTPQILGAGGGTEGLGLLVEWPECGGYAHLHTPNEQLAARLVEALDGREWRGRRLVAMPLAEATAKLRVHQRVKTALRRLNASEPAAQGAATTSVQPASDTGAEAVDGAEAMASKSRKKRAKSFHNFMSDKGRLRGTSQSLQALSHCSSAMLQDIRGQRTRRETDGSSSFAGVDAAGSASWVESHWVVLSFAARDFSPQQVRRMAGVVAAVVSGRLPLEFIDRCFEEEVQTRTHLPDVAPCGVCALTNVVRRSHRSCRLHSRQRSRCGSTGCSSRPRLKLGRARVAACVRTPSRRTPSVASSSRTRCVLRSPRSRHLHQSCQVWVARCGDPGTW